jgi:hypothetical protein
MRKTQASKQSEWMAIFFSQQMAIAYLQQATPS